MGVLERLHTFRGVSVSSIEPGEQLLGCFPRFRIVACSVIPGKVEQRVFRTGRVQVILDWRIQQSADEDPDDQPESNQEYSAGLFQSIYPPKPESVASLGATITLGMVSSNNCAISGCEA